MSRWPRRHASRSTITPTYSGCPAMNVIALEVELGARGGRLRRARGSRPCSSPAWTTDWMTEAAARKLRDYGIAPPAPRRSRARAVRRRRGRLPALRLGATPSGSPSSARPPARRCGAAAPAASRSIISSASELHALRAAALPPAHDREIRPRRRTRCRSPSPCRTALARGLSLHARPVSDPATEHRRREECAAPIRSARARRRRTRVAVKKVAGGRFSELRRRGDQAGRRRSR